MYFTIPPTFATADLLSAATAHTFGYVTAAAIAPCPFSAALATGADATDNIPAVNADTASSAMRCLIVFVDIFFLSLVEFEYFPISARRSFDPLIPSPLAHTCNAK